eukprot:m.67335 g.67335  ORF g.67335 m.67335 type:complete len:551 (-) comp9859_c0_seq1:1737-3389(-)
MLRKTVLLVAAAAMAAGCSVKHPELCADPRPLATQSPSDSPFRFASSQGDNMVLQQAPASATVWGYVPAGQTVKVTFNGQSVEATQSIWLGNNTWSANLPPMQGSLTQAYNITAATNDASITLANVLFGEVWVCSGQSNMQYPLGSPTCWNASNLNCTTKDAQCGYGCVNNSGVEIAAMAEYPHMRLYMNTYGGSKVPLAESSNTGWLLPEDMGGKFSAMCWFFGRDLYSKLSPQVPVGLIETNVGGTPDQHWSSQDALDRCTQAATGQPWGWPPNYNDSVLWNGKVVPLLRNVIKGAIWMQGEANAGADGRLYNCSFPAMIRDWRAKWTEGTGGATAAEFPFGWAQLNSDGNPTVWAMGGTQNNRNSSTDPLGEWTSGFSSIRNAESHTLSVENTFQAVILDTPVTSGSVHSPFKQPAGDRLARGALAVAYGEPHPTPTVESVVGTSSGITVTVSGIEAGAAVEIRSKFGFEVLGSDNAWHTVAVTGSTTSTVTIGTVPGATAVRYLFSTAPCTSQPYSCAVYVSATPLGSLSGEWDFLPLGPFVRALH